MGWVLASSSTRGANSRWKHTKKTTNFQKFFPELFLTELIHQTWCARQSKQFLWGSDPGFSTFSLVPEVLGVQLRLQRSNARNQKSASRSHSCGEQNRSKTKLRCENKHRALWSFSAIPCILQGRRNLTVFTIPRTEPDKTSLWSLFLWFFHVSWFPLMCFFVLVFDFFKYQPPLQRYSSAKSKSALV